MPQEEKPDLESDRKFVEKICSDSEVLGKCWIKDSNLYVGKPDSTLGAFILSDHGERVIFLMGSDCDPEDLLKREGKVLSDESALTFFGGEDLSESVARREEQMADHACIKEFSDTDDHGGESETNQDTSREDLMPSTIVVESKGREDNTLGYDHSAGTQDKEKTKLISYSNEFQGEFQDQEYSGTFPYSGSISLRSTSSTASTQSFAFPILADEWNSSPQRMPTPDKRQLRKRTYHKMKWGWVCCKF